MKDFAKRMKALRKKSGKSLAEVAHDIGVSISSLSLYENGKRTPRDDIKQKFADYYNVSVGSIFFNH